MHEERRFQIYPNEFLFTFRFNLVGFAIHDGISHATEPGSSNTNRECNANGIAFVETKETTTGSELSSALYSEFNGFTIKKNRI